ncbi:unnamed protein product, partial [Cyprideis torosa]
MPDIGHYMDFVMTLFMAFGIGFEMPVATVLLIATGMTTRENLAKKRPYIIVGAFIVGMLLTPPDVISQLLLAIPMWLLFEVGLIVSAVFAKQIAIAGKEKAAQEQAERDAADAEYATPPKPESPFEAAKAAGAAGAVATAAEATASATEETTEQDFDDFLWEDEKYTYSDADEVSDDLQFEDTDEYRPLTDEEMEAELARIEAEEEADEASTEDDEAARQAEANALMKHLLVDISAHGFGHLAQTAAVLNALDSTDIRITIRSLAPEHLLRERIKHPFQLIPYQQDNGVIMHDALRVDAAASMAWYQDFHANYAQRRQQAVRELDALKPDLLFADVPYLSLDAA